MGRTLVFIAWLVSALSLGACAAPRSAAAPADWSLLVQQIGPSGLPIDSIRIESDGEIRRALAGGPLMVIARADAAAQRELMQLASPMFDEASAAGSAANSTTETSASQPPTNAQLTQLKLKSIRRSNGTVRERWLSGENALKLWSAVRVAAGIDVAPSSASTSLGATQP